ncbi:MAG: fumarylacetoacetate hydrolase family protein [Bacillota bacterium]
MSIVRYYEQSRGQRLGLLLDEKVYDLSDLTGSRITSFLELVQCAGGSRIGAYIEQKISPLINQTTPWQSYQTLDAEPADGRNHLLTPLDPPEVWAAGVTYKRSQEAREFETTAKSIYDRVYEAKRPEIFFKATPSRIAGPYEKVCLRSDAHWMVPEPELGLVLGNGGEILGYIIGNDMSSRDIEGENPLYLPQAKVFKNSCALGPVIAPADKVPDANNLKIDCKIIRQGIIVYQDSASTSQLKRSFAELVDYLCRDNVIPAGTVLLTGTCLVPPDDFTLLDGDIIEITIDHLGTLRNTALQL